MNVSSIYLNVNSAKTINKLFVFSYNVLGRFINGYVLKTKGIYFHIHYSAIYFLMVVFKYSSFLSVGALMDIIVVDKPSNGINRFEVVYVFWSFLKSIRIYLKLFNNGIKPILSLVSFYKSSSWLEREVWDLFGVKFYLHGILRRILTDYGFEGHPLRKDFPMIGYLDLVYDNVLHSITIDTVEVNQSFRFYDFENPWNYWK